MTIQLEPNEQAMVALVEETQSMLGRIVKRNRQVLDLTQCDLGARAGVHQTRISCFEKHGSMTFDLLIRAAHGLGVRPSELLRAAESRTPISECIPPEDRYDCERLEASGGS